MGMEGAHEEDSTTKYGQEVNNKSQLDQRSPAQTKNSGGFHLDDYLDHLENQESLVRNKDPGCSLRTSTSDQFGAAYRIDHNS
jgi:hypothetical protein